MLTRLEGADRPLDVERVRQRDVDGLDVGILEEFLVAAIGSLETLLACVRLRPNPVTTPDRDDLHAVGPTGAGEHQLVDASGGKDAPGHGHRTTRVTTRA